MSTNKVRYLVLAFCVSPSNGKTAAAAAAAARRIFRCAVAGLATLYFISKHAAIQRRATCAIDDVDDDFETTLRALNELFCSARASLVYSTFRSI